MEQKSKRSIKISMRTLHRDIGFFTVGLVILYSLSGIVLIYRDTGFMKQKTQVERKLAVGLEPEELGKALQIRDFRVINSVGETVYFKDGSYSQSTGVAVYTAEDIIFPFNRFIELHKTRSGGVSHWFGTAFGMLLFFMAISSFWMVRKGSALFRRSLYLAGAGIVLTIILLMI